MLWYSGCAQHIVRSACEDRLALVCSLCLGSVAVGAGESMSDVFWNLGNRDIAAAKLRIRESFEIQTILPWQNDSAL